MGYTHYWSHGNIPVKEWTAFLDVAAKILVRGEKEGIKPAFEFDEPGTPARIGPGEIHLNGIGEDAHEDFYFAPESAEFEFCKTARKPYDALVTAILLAAYAAFGPEGRPGKRGGISIRSDGDWPDWEAGRRLYTLATGKNPSRPPEVELVDE